ncbi:MAG: hypothetical protein CFH40_00981, partial [Alphaproteobacteria bacterium MarineAlpha10_Bin3]
MARAILVYGTDAGLVLERANALARSVAEDLSDPFLVAEITAASLREEPTRIADEAASISLTGGRRVVRVRDASDAILIGSGTARIDDPRLTVRPAPPDGRQPVRVVLDSRAALASRARMLREPGQTLVIAT